MIKIEYSYTDLKFQWPFYFFLDFLIETLSGIIFQLEGQFSAFHRKKQQQGYKTRHK